MLTFSPAGTEENVGGLSRCGRNQVCLEWFQIVSIRGNDSHLMPGDTEVVLAVQGCVDDAQQVGFLRLQLVLRQRIWQSFKSTTCDNISEHASLPPAYYSDPLKSGLVTKETSYMIIMS